MESFSTILPRSFSWQNLQFNPVQEVWGACGLDKLNKPFCTKTCWISENTLLCPRAIHIGDRGGKHSHRRYLGPALMSPDTDWHMHPVRLSYLNSCSTSVFDWIEIENISIQSKMLVEPVKKKNESGHQHLSPACAQQWDFVSYIRRSAPSPDTSRTCKWLQISCVNIQIVPQLGMYPSKGQLHFQNSSVSQYSSVSGIGISAGDLTAMFGIRILTLI